MPRRIFIAMRFPGITIFFMMLLCAFAFAGWHLFGSDSKSGDPSQLQQRMFKNLEKISEYHVVYNMNLFINGKNQEYSVQIWKNKPNLYRLEMSSLHDDYLQVMIYDGSRTYLYNRELGDFYPVNNLKEEKLPYLSLEDYWKEIAEAKHFTFMSEKKGLRHNYYQVEVFPAEPHRYRTREIVWMEANSLLPVRLEVYDLHGSLTQITTFEMIQLNPVLEATLFMVEP